LSSRADKILKKLCKSKSNTELRAQLKLMKVAEGQKMSRLGSYNPHKAPKNMIGHQQQYHVHIQEILNAKINSLIAI